jgi:AraC-like DNA-binding protein
LLDPTRDTVCRVLHEGPGFRLGYFECPPHDPRWDSVNWIGPTVLIAFPMRRVVIRQPSYEVLTDPNIAVFYEAEQTFTRELADPRGDRCTYVEIDHELMEEIAPGARSDGPIPVDGRIYMTQWSCLRSLAAGAELDHLALDELFITILTRVLTAPRTERIVRSQVELVANARALLGERFAQPITLDEIAREVHCSPFHLSRTFRRVMGTTLHDYLTQLRLRDSLERVSETTTPLDRVACDLGFSSHSHFTARFRASFGVKPSDLRKQTVPITRLHGLLVGAI